MRVLPAALAIAFSVPASGQEGATPETLADIVVTARPGPPRPEPGAAAWFRTLCFDPMRRTGATGPPPEAEGWLPLDAAARAALRIGGADPAFGLASKAERRTLLFRAERFDRPARLRETRCTLVVIGGGEHDRLAAEVPALFGGGPTERHVGKTDGAVPLPGWRRRLWSGMPGRGSAAWRAINGSGGARGARDTWLVVTDPGFYRSYDYVLAELKTSERPGQRVSVLTLSLTTAGRRGGR